MADRGGDFSFSKVSMYNLIKELIKESSISMITKFALQVLLHDSTQMTLIKQVLVTSLRQDYVIKISTTEVSIPTRFGRMVT